MTGSDRPFRRPPSDTDSESFDEESFSGNLGVAGDPSQPLILDPELHESVWKPWHQAGMDPVNDDAADASDVGSPPMALQNARRQRGGWMMAGTLVVGVIAAFVFPSVLQQPFSAAQTLVMDIPDRPSLSWTAESGQRCLGNIDTDHMILSNTYRVWSLDLRTR